MWRDILPGGRVSASDINNLADWGEQTVTGNVGVTRSAAGLHIATPDDARILIRITGAADAGAYPWEEVYRDAVLGSIEVVGDGRTGTTDDVPAYELNDTEDVPEGTVCEATLDDSGEFLMFEVPGSALPGATVTTVDGTPNYTDIETWKFDETDGFVLTNPDTGVVRIDIQGASASQAGIVLTTAQTWAGNKIFNNKVAVNMAAVDADYDLFASNIKANTTVRAPNLVGNNGTFANGSDVTVGHASGITFYEAGIADIDGPVGDEEARIVVSDDVTAGEYVMEITLSETPTATPPLVSFLVSLFLQKGKLRLEKPGGSGAPEPVYSCQGSDGVSDTQGGLVFVGGIFTGGTLAIDGGDITGTIDGGTW